MANNWVRYLKNFFFYNHKTFYDLTYQWVDDFCRLTWNNVYEVENEFTEIWVSINGTDFYLAGTTGVNALTFDLVGLPQESDIRIKIRTVNLFNCYGDWSDIISFRSPVIYYIKNGGNDLLNGRSDADAWSTIAKVNTLVPDPGNRILFKRGSTWREQLYFTGINGTADQKITIGAYGVGNDPRLLGSLDGETIGWANLGGNKYATPNNSFPYEVYMLFYDTNAVQAVGTKVALEADLNVNWEFWWDNVNKRVIVYHSLGSPETQCNGMEITGIFQGADHRGYVIYLNNCDHWNVEDINSRYCNHYVLVVYQSNYVSMKRCSILYGHNKGYYFDDTEFCELIDSTSYDMGYCGNTTGGESIWFAYCENGLIRGCEVELPHNIGIDCFGSDNCIVEMCNVHDLAVGGHAASGGIYFDNSDNCIARRSIVSNMPRGFAVNAEGVLYWSDNIAIYSNIAIDCEMNYKVGCNVAVSDHVTNIYFFNNVSYYSIAGNANYAGFRMEYCTGLTIRNNILIDQQAAVKYNFRLYSTVINCTSDYNLFYFSAGAHNFHHGIPPSGMWDMYADLATYQAGTGFDMNSIEANPLVVGAPDFHLTALSPAKYTGEPSRFVPDFDGVQWHFPPSIGAYEYNV